MTPEMTQRLQQLNDKMGMHASFTPEEQAEYNDLLAQQALANGQPLPEQPEPAAPEAPAETEAATWVEVTDETVATPSDFVEVPVTPEPAPEQPVEEVVFAEVQSDPVIVAEESLAAHLEGLRDLIAKFEQFLETHPNELDREVALARTKLQEAEMWLKTKF